VPIDWSKVTVDHVKQACELFDAGAAVPKRPAKSTFLVFNGKSYPAKFIRGLAYRIATGVELDPSKDFTGGDETARFFANLGLQTSASATPTVAPSPPVPQPTPVIVAAAPPTGRKYEPQKQALFDLLKKRFGTVEWEAEFPWLVVPKLDELKEPLASIFQALQAMRGFSNFAGAGRSLRCDFYIPQERLIVEYDERQHFTLQRAKALGLYPADISLEFDRQEWIKTCNTIKATDPNPPYRDEQRAFYDSLRDIFAAQNGYRLARFHKGDFDWTCHEAEEKLVSAISAPVPVPASAKQSVEPVTEIKKIALVAHDYTVPDSRGFYDYSEHFARINKLCDDQGCDTILYALYTWDSTSPVPRTHDSMFDALKHVRQIVLEVGKPRKGYDHVEVWVRGQHEPMIAYQRFAEADDPVGAKRLFIDDLPSRQVSSTLLVICGETNITRLKRATKTFDDPFGFVEQLQGLNPRLILNPVHDYMTRPEMKKKRRFYSQGGRIVVSVWNRGRGKESWRPWTAYHDGEERTDGVLELEQPFAERPDIRIGLLDLNGG
jgi:hypothetical protein